MNFEKMCQAVEQHRMRIQGKKKFIEQILSADIKRTPFAATDNITCNFSDTALGDLTEYITLWTATIGGGHIIHATETGEIDLQVRLGYHIHNKDTHANSWYYSAIKKIHAQQLPKGIYNYLLRKMMYSDVNEVIQCTHRRAYSAIVDSYNDVLDIIKNDFQYGSEQGFYSASDGSSVHPIGTYTRTEINRAATLQYMDFYPEFTEDMFFNIQLQGLHPMDVYSNLNSIQYIPSTELRSTNIGDSFWQMCNDTL